MSKSELELHVPGETEGHSTRKFNLEDKEDIDDLAEVIKQKLDDGWILYGGKKKGDLKKLMEGRNKSKNEIKEIFREKENIMLDSPHDSDEESVFYEKAMLAPATTGG